MKTRFFKPLAYIALTLAISIPFIFPVSAQNITNSETESISLTTRSDTLLCFSEAEFYSESGEGLEGIMISKLPSKVAGTTLLGSRVLAAGDVIPAQYLNQISFLPRNDYEAKTGLEYLPIYADGLGATRILLGINVISSENFAPIVRDLKIETYKNVAIAGHFAAEDPEGDPLGYTIVSEPGRGSVVVTKDNMFIYTPAKNKVGRDKFTYTATDSEGNVSEKATVSVQIKKPGTKITYSDMDGHESYYAALRLADENIFVGESLNGRHFFLPDKEVSRGEFLAMVVNLAGLEMADESLSTGFADEASTPDWVKPYITTALKSGVISGVASENGSLVFRPQAALTKAEAAVILNKALGLMDVDTSQEVFAAAVPTWAYQATANLRENGIFFDKGAASYDMAKAVTRAETAWMLSEAMDILKNRAAEKSLLSWAIR